MKFITGSFFDKDLLEEAKEKGWRVFSIAVSQPKGGTLYRELTLLTPLWKLVSKYRAGRITQEEYTESFRRQTLKKATLGNLMAMLESNRYPRTPVLLLCWEKEGEFCHRQIVAKWLKKRGQKVEVY